MSTIEPFVGTYPDDENFWVPGDQEASYPARYGDLYNTPDELNLVDSRDRPWKAVMVLHPSCEMGAKGAPLGAQIVRVHLLREVSGPQRDEVRVGYREREFGVAPVRVNMVYLAPPPAGPHQEELYADLRDTARVSLDKLNGAGRIAAMSHDARIAVLRRDIYFRYRWDIPVSELVRLEGGRIAADSAFQGPKPPWAGTAQQ